MFLRNIEKIEQFVYEEAAKKCGIKVTFWAAQRDTIPVERLKDYISIHVPGWMNGEAVSAFLAIVDTLTISVDKKIDFGNAVPGKRLIINAFCKACDQLYDPSEEKDPVDVSVWSKIFDQGITDPNEAVAQFEEMEMA